MKDLEYLNLFEIATHLNAFATNSKRLDSAVTKLQTANQKQQFVNKSPTQRKGTTQQCPTSTGSQPVSGATRHSVASWSLETKRSAENQSMESVGNISYANIFRSTSVDKNVQSKGNLLQSTLAQRAIRLLILVHRIVVQIWTSVHREWYLPSQDTLIACTT